jgi:hypothetical protein
LTQEQKEQHLRKGRCFGCHHIGHHLANCPLKTPPQEFAEYGRPAPTNENDTIGYGRPNQEPQT